MLTTMYNPLLDTFCRTAELGSFAKTAYALSCSTVAVMNQINALEAHLGLTLFVRTPRGVKLTEAGQLIFQHAKRLQAESQEIIKQAKKLLQKDQVVIRVGTSILRPCRELMRLWSALDSKHSPFQISIIPFDDAPEAMLKMMLTLGHDIDCFMSPCDAKDWKSKYTVYPLGYYPCRLAVPRQHRLATKSSLTWADLAKEKLILIPKGQSQTLDALRQDIEVNQREITIIDAPSFYDTRVFNICVEQNCLMETLDIWQDVHPGLVTLPMDWDYAIEYGIILANKAEKHVLDFVELLLDSIKKA